MSSKKRGLPAPRATTTTTAGSAITATVKSGEGQNEQTLLVEQGEFHSGPLPPPHIMEGYRQLVPDAPERILRQMEIQSEHRRALDTRIVDAHIGQKGLGQKLAAGLTGGVLVLAGGLALGGHAEAAAAVGIAVVTAGVVALLGGKAIAHKWGGGDE